VVAVRSNPDELAVQIPKNVNHLTLLEIHFLPRNSHQPGIGSNVTLSETKARRFRE
jgi:hypothetical protein